MGLSCVRLNNKFLCHNPVNHKAVSLAVLFLLVSLSPFVQTTSANEIEDIEVLQTVVNPANNHTYHLLSASSWSDAASVARSLGGFLVTVDDADEDPGEPTTGIVVTAPQMTVTFSRFSWTLTLGRRRSKMISSASTDEVSIKLSLRTAKWG